MTLKKKARIAGVLYLVVVITGIFSLMYVPSKLIDWENAAITFNNIVGNETLFRVGIISYLICYSTFLFLPLVLHKLLKSTDQIMAELMVILAVLIVPISFINIQHKLNVLSLISGESYLNVFSNDQLQAQVLLYLNHYNNGNLIASIFFGLWLLPFGYLVLKSGFLPKFLGVLLMIGCFSYLINFTGHALMANYSQLGISSYIQLPASLGEIGICLWLLIVGAKEGKSLNQTQ